MDGTIFLDTNILIYAANEDSVYHKQAMDVINMVNTREIRACVSPQILAEFYATVTNPKKIEHPLNPDEASDAIGAYLDSDIQKLYPKASTLKLTMELAERYKIRGLDIFDTQIVAAMLENKIKTIIKANEADFSKFKEIETVNPLI
ncbi:MAG: PIN domain-containing protein [Candidatus Tectomicrobia bacterium]|uniref:PIN domain-containing protein n=1 Tax=Tectimicrobiota bacterium TaxID=2528274 RepID=A0A933GN01_UNCTE|nr:PIN domain-containing protein [Candidatus Tectomicrobia bacterium]